MKRKKTTKKAPAISVSNNFFLMLLAFVVIMSALVLTVFNKPTETISADQLVTELDIQKDDMANFVDSASLLLGKVGEKAYPRFRESSSWYRSSRYLFIYDFSGKVIVMPSDKSLEGTNMWGAKDVNGKLYVQEMVKKLKNRDVAFVYYANPKSKVAYVRKMTVGGKAIIVGSEILTQ